jgi:hypothetical protein
MTPLATTKRTSPSAELARLDQVLDEMHVEVLKARRVRDEWDQETQQLRAELGARRETHQEEFVGAQFHPRAGTEAERLHLQIKQRLAEVNPFEDAYGSSRAAFAEADEELQTFLRARIADLIAERDGEVDGALGQIRAGFEKVLSGCIDYRAAAEDAQLLAARVPGLQRIPNMTGSDGQVEQWEAVARGAVEAEVGKPGLTATALWRLENIG